MVGSQQSQRLVDEQFKAVLRKRSELLLSVFFFHDTATTVIYTLSLHDALPIFQLAEPARLLLHEEQRHLGRHLDGDALLGAQRRHAPHRALQLDQHRLRARHLAEAGAVRSEEHTSELQSRRDLVCRLLLEKKKK